ncbi:DNA excision repair protein ERCC-6-like [Stigmatopora nigra]
MNGHHDNSEVERHYDNSEVEKIQDKLEKCLSMDEEDDMEIYQRHIQGGKNAVREGDMKKALELFNMANNIHRSDKLQKRIEKIEEFLTQNLEDGDDDEFVEVNNSGLKLYKDLYDKLYDYQKNGVAFLYGLYRDERKGGILADDMGLGKTIQVISFLSGMYDNGLVKHTILVMPTSLITNWTKEFTKWTPGMRIKEFHGTSKPERNRNLEKIQRRGGVIITTYTMLINNWQQLSTYEGREFKWDYMILDEAHKIKSSTTKTAKSASNIPSKNRVLLTGTPVQNNLRELWALFNFACQGTLLGTAKTFKMEYENPITRAREKDATPGERALGSRMSENLMAIIQPYFMRRTKAEVQKNKENKKNGTSYAGSAEKKTFENQEDLGAEMPSLTRKNDLIVWTYLSSIQEDIYWKFISLEHIKELLTTSRSPLAELTILKKLCDHPRLLSTRATASLGLQDVQQVGNDDNAMDSRSLANVSDETLIAESGKLAFLVTLLKRLKDEGHRTLVFAHYRMVLDILQRILKNQGFKVLRLDGSITQVTERERLITLFQTDHSYSVFLLTTQVGGVGITLTAADRVVIYDPSWNPATDAQAVDRAYRIGQTRNVVIYRLITCGTVEEKIYRRQVFKDSLIRQNTGDKKNPFRYFSKEELRELFNLENPRSSSTQLQLQSLHAKHRSTDPVLDMHLADLHTMDMFGISDHDLMFTLNVDHDEAPQNMVDEQYIKGRVQKAQQLVKAESDLQMQFTTTLESCTEPMWRRKSISEREEPTPDKKFSKPKARMARSPRRSNMSPSRVDLEQSVDNKEGDSQGRNSMTDLTGKSPPQEKQNISRGRSQSPFKQRKSQDFTPHEAGSRENVKVEDSFREVKKASPNVSTASSVNESLNQKYSEMSLDGKQKKPVQNQRLSVLQSSPGSLKVDSWCRVSGSSSDLLEANFNLQLEESGLSDQDDERKLPSQNHLVGERESLFQDDEEEEDEKLLSKLQISGTFDVGKSLTERSLGLSVQSNVSEMDKSVVGARKKKRAAVIIIDSEEEEEMENVQFEGQVPQTTMTVFNSLAIQGSSTPKSSPGFSCRRSVGGNRSRRSVVHAVTRDFGHTIEASVRSSDEGEVEDVSSMTHDGTGVTSNSDEEDEEVEEEEDEDVNPGSSKLEETSSDPELSREMVTSKTSWHSDANVTDKAVMEWANVYESLVLQGHEKFHQGQFEEALDSFLNAIEIQPGDPEIQSYINKLKRQLDRK